MPCGGELKIIAAIEETTVIAKILDHLGLPSSHLRCAVPASLAVQPSHPGLSFAAQSQLTRPALRRETSISSNPLDSKSLPVSIGSVRNRLSCSAIAFRQNATIRPNHA
ncbi:MAG: hypothetical protein ACRERU_11080 [Methylococcales bacterium]